MLSADELARYGRQLVLPELGVAGQERIRRTRVLVVGAGGLGSPAALYLAAAGVGTLGIVDDDVVEISNLHRQVLHGTADLGRSKVHSAADALARLNPLAELRQHTERLTAENAEGLIADYDLVVDGSDNYATRYAVNDACAALGTVWVYGSVERYSGQVSVFGAPDGPCYRCVFSDPPAAGSTASCEEIGVLGAVPGVVGSLQALEALKWITGIGEPLVGRLLQMDFLTGQMRTVRFGKRAGCRACGGRHRKENASMGTKDTTPNVPLDVQPEEVAGLISGAQGEGVGMRLLDVREPWELARARIGDAQSMPMSALGDKVDSLDKSRDYVVYCHHGSRSRMATEWLRSLGFRARNLAGGIDRWSREIDPAVPRY
ncbi:MAG: HesA/MoeB/ThiF family protein [Gemmatimonadaceae bacterium]